MKRGKKEIAPEVFIPYLSSCVRQRGEDSGNGVLTYSALSPLLAHAEHGDVPPV